MPRDFNTKSMFVGETHGRVTPRVEELSGQFARFDGAAATTNLWGVRWSKLCVNGMRNGVSAATGMGGNERDAHPIIRRVVVRLGGGILVGVRLGLLGHLLCDHRPVIAGPPPLNDTAVRSSPNACLSISPARKPGVPSPAWP